MAATFPLAVTVNLKDNLTTGWARMEATLRARGTSLQNWGKQASKYMTAPLTAFAALSVRAGMNWESSLQRIQRATGATGEETRAFGDELRKQADTGTHSLESMMNAAVEASGEMRNLADAQQLVASSLKLSHVSGVDVVETLQSLNRVAQAYAKSEPTKLPMLADILARGDLEEGPGGLKDIAQAAGTVAPWAKKLGFEGVVAQILAARRGGLVDWGRLTKGMMASLQGKDGSARSAFERALAADRKATGKTPVENLQSIISLAAQQEAMAKTGKESLQSLMNAFSDVLIEGSNSGLLDGFKTVLRIGTKLLGWLGSLPQPVKTAVVYLGALAAVAGPVTYGLGKMIAIASKAKTAWGLLTTATVATKLAVKGLGVALMTNPWGIALGVLAHGALLVINNWDLVKEKVGAVWEWARAKWDATWGWVLRNIEAAKEFFGFGGGDAAPISGASMRGGGAGYAPLPAFYESLALSPLTAPSGAPAQAEITVNIRGAPKGTSVQSRGDADVTTNLGLAMPHVLGN